MEARTSAPTVALVLKWLRDEKKLHCHVCFLDEYANKWHWDWYSLPNNGLMNEPKFKDNMFETYDAAVSSAIDYILDLLTQ